MSERYRQRLRHEHVRDILRVRGFTLKYRRPLQNTLLMHEANRREALDRLTYPVLVIGANGQSSKYRSLEHVMNVFGIDEPAPLETAAARGTRRQKMVLDAIESGARTVTEAVDVTGITTDAVKWHVRNLHNTGVVRRVQLQTSNNLQRYKSLVEFEPATDTSHDVRPYSTANLTEDVYQAICGGASTTRQIADITGYVTTTALRHAQVLVEQGRVIRRDHPTDGRMHQYFPTTHESTST